MVTRDDEYDYLFKGNSRSSLSRTKFSISKILKKKKRKKSKKVTKKFFIKRTEKKKEKKFP